MGAEQLKQQRSAPQAIQQPIGGMPLGAVNPYAIPSEKVLQRMLQEDLGFDGFDFSNAPLASVVSRLLAVLVDGILDGVAIVVGVLLLFGADHFGILSVESLELGESLGLELYVITGFPWLALKIIQWNLIATRGQTLGKILFFVRIVSMNGKPPGFVCGVLLRQWVRNALGVIPFFG